MVTGNVLPGKGPIRTLRVSAYSNEMTPLSGTGTLFELRVAGYKAAGRATQLVWSDGLQQFMFIDSNLKMRAPAFRASGSIGGEQATEKAAPAPASEDQEEEEQQQQAPDTDTETTSPNSDSESAANQPWRFNVLVAGLFASITDRSSTKVSSI